MGPYPSEYVPFDERLRASIRREPFDASTLKVRKHANVYTSGEGDGKVYFIESGQIKILVLSPDGKQCLSSIYTTGDIFGELCLAGGDRVETATAMRDSILKQMVCAKFLARLTRDGLAVDFIKYVAMRLVDQQRVITNLATADCERRLAATLLRLARKLGQHDSLSLRLEQRISHQELSEMVGTTRPRISELMQKFRHLGLIETTSECFLIVKEHYLAEYLAKAASPAQASIRPRPTDHPQNNFLCRSNIGQTVSASRGYF